MTVSKQRLDLLLVEKGLYPTREKAQAAIMAGLIMVGEKKIDKAGTKVDSNSVLKILGNVCPYVSRGGLKLEKAVNYFALDLQDKIMLDIGASTGGFTDCALQNGAKKVYAVDVGYGQLAWSLRQDERVVNLERTNIRYLQPEALAEAADLATIDVAFISLDKVLPTAVQLLQPEGEIIALIKPQFEAGREKVGKKGVVKDPKVHEEVIAKVIALAHSLKLAVKNLTFSPIKGPEGNIEFLIYLTKLEMQEETDWLAKIPLIVEETKNL